MGLFDYLRCEHPSLPEEYRNREFQTKDGDNPFLENYLITKDGRLLHEECEYEWNIDHTKKGFEALKGALSTKSKEWKDTNFHGLFHFYDENDEFCAKFTDGNLALITRINTPISDERKG